MNSNPSVNRILSTLAAIAVFIAIVQLTDMVGGKYFPLPAGVDYHNTIAVKQYVSTLPIKASLLLLAGYTLAAFAGSVVGTVVSGRILPRTATIIAIAATFSNALNGVMRGHPVWFIISAVVLSAGAAALGYLIAKKRITD